MRIRFARGVAAVPIVVAGLGSMPAQAKNDNFELVSTIAFSNAIPNTPGPMDDEEVFNSGEIYLIDPDPDDTNPRRLTDNHAADAFAALSPDDKKIVFDSNRLRDVTTEPPEPLNTSDLFVMNTDGTEQQHLTRGGSPTWSPDSKRIAFHASASGTGLPVLATPGAATSDSDLFVANVDDLLTGVEVPRNVTNNPDVDDDPDWSPDGHTLVFTRHLANDNHNNPLSTEIYTLNVDGTGEPERLTFNNYEERGPDFSPDGTRIVFMCRSADPLPPPAPQVRRFQLCVMNADGTVIELLNTVGYLGPKWSPDGQQIVFQRAGLNQLFVINADGTGATQITGRPDEEPQGWNGIVSWDLLRVRADS